MTINGDAGTVTLSTQALLDALERARQAGYDDGYEGGQIDLAATLALGVVPTLAFESAAQ